MKTSIKLFIAGLLCVPLSLFAYNLLLKRQLDARNILVEMVKDPKYATIINKLPPFKHIKVNGTLYTGADGKQGVNNVSWIARVKVDNMEASGPVMKMPVRYKDVVSYHVQNDTLYLSYYKKNNPEELENQYDGMMRVTIDGGGKLRSVTGLNTTFETTGNFRNNDSLSITVAGISNYEIQSLYLDKLNITIKGDAKMNVHDMVLKEFAYNLHDKGKLTIAPLNIKHFTAGQIDGGAEININGNANSLKTLLK